MADDHQQPGALGKPDNGRNPANAEVDSLVFGASAPEKNQRAESQADALVDARIAPASVQTIKVEPEEDGRAPVPPVADVILPFDFDRLDPAKNGVLGLLRSIDRNTGRSRVKGEPADGRVYDRHPEKESYRSETERTSDAFESTKDSTKESTKERIQSSNNSESHAEAQRVSEKISAGGQAKREGVVASQNVISQTSNANEKQEKQQESTQSSRISLNESEQAESRIASSEKTAAQEIRPSTATGNTEKASTREKVVEKPGASEKTNKKTEASDKQSEPLTKAQLERLALRNESGQFISKEEKQAMSAGELQQARMRQERKEKESQDRQESLISQLAHSAESVITEGGDTVDAAGTAAGGAYYSAGKELYTAYQQVAGEDSKIRQSFEWLKEKTSSSSDSVDAEVAPADSSDSVDAEVAPAEAGPQKITDSLSLAMAEARSEKAADLDGSKEQVGLLKRMAAYLGLIADKSEDQKRKTQVASIQETREKETLSDSISMESENQIEVIRQTSSEAATRESESHTENQESMAEINSTLEEGFESVSSSVTSASGGRGGGLLDLLGLGEGRRGRRGGRGRGGGRLARAGRMAGVAKGAGGLARGTLTAGSRLLGPLAALAAGGMAWNNTRNELADREDLSDEQKSTIAASTGIGSGGGALGGALAGGAAGAAIGSVVPVVGTLIGGAIGSVVGGLAGAWGGEKAGRAVGEMIAGDGEEQFEEALYGDVEQAQDGAIDAMSEDRARMTGSAASSEDGLLSRIAREEANASESGLLSRVADPDSSNLADSTLAAGSASQQAESKGLLGRAAELLGPEGLGRMNPLVNVASSLFGRGRNPSAEDQAGEARSEPRGIMSRVVDALGPEGLGKISPIAGMLGANQDGGLLGRLFGRRSQESVAGEAEASEGGLLSRAAGQEANASESGLLSRVQESMESIADAAPAASRVESDSAEAVSGGAVIEQQSIEPVNPKDAAKALQQNIVVQQPKEPRQKNTPSSSDRELMLSSKSGGGAKSALGNASAQGVKEITADFSETVLTLMAMDRI